MPDDLKSPSDSGAFAAQQGHGAPDTSAATDEVQRMHAPIYRENMEPRDGYEPVPIVWVLLIIGLVMWGGWYLGQYTADFQPRAYDGPTALQQGGGLPQDIDPAGPIDPMLLGRRVYNNCIGCHQADGLGSYPQFPPLAGSDYVNGDEAVLARILLQGLVGPIQVQGRTYNGNMPGWRQKSDAELAAVMTFIRQSWGNDAAPVTPESVAAIREETRSRRQSWTAAELVAWASGPSTKVDEPKPTATDQRP
ncbi:MAG: c-type cytochrome [Phycisphaerae bacterium]